MQVRTVSYIQLQEKHNFRSQAGWNRADRQDRRQGDHGWKAHLAGCPECQGMEHCHSGGHWEDDAHGL